MKRKLALAGALVLALGAIGGGAAAASTGGSGGGNGGGESDAGETDVPITGSELAPASEAALAFTGEGKVTDTEVGDEESYYEVEVTLDNGNEVDVQLDRDFSVVGSEVDKPGKDD